MWWLVLGAVTFLVWWFLHDSSHLDSLPGPPKKPIIGNSLEFVTIDARSMFVLLREYTKVYGDRYLIKIFKRRILHVHSPADVEAVLSHSRNITKSKPYKFLKPWLGTGLLISTGKKWHIRRRILTPTFHFNILKNFATIIEEKSRDLITKMKAKKEAEVDVFPAISDFTLFTICETAMGTQLDQDKSASTLQYKSAILQIGSMMLNRLTRVWLHVDFIFNMSKEGKKFAGYLEKAQSFADNVILERKKQRASDPVDMTVDDVGTKKRLAMLDLLLEAETKGEIDLEGIREEVNTFMFEGHDTTATALTFALMLLADHDDVQERVYEECQQIFGDDERVPTMTDLAQMKYLDAVIKETLRLYPSVPFVAREITEDFMMGDLLIQKGVEIGVHIYDLHRRADLYPEPEAFRPDRFLGNQERHPYAYVPFSAGPRNCIGQRFAMQEIKCVLSEICRHFTLTPRVRGWRPRLVSDLVLRSDEPIYVKFIRR